MSLSKHRVERQKGRGRLSSNLLLLLNLPAALRKMSIAALTQFTVYCRRLARGDEARLNMGSLIKKAVVVLLYHAIKLRDVGCV